MSNRDTNDTPPDFESIPDIGMRMELKRISKLMEYMERENSEAHIRVFSALSEMNADRRWFKWIATMVGGIIAAGIVIVLYGASKLDSIQGSVDKHIAECTQIMVGFRKDVDRNSQYLERLMLEVREMDRIGPRPKKTANDEE